LVDSLAAGHRFRREGILAWARVLVALGPLLLAYAAGPVLSHQSLLVRILTAGYLGVAIVILGLIRSFTEPHYIFQLCVHITDVAYAAFVYLLLENSQSPMLLIFFFAILAAAYRWGLAEAFATALTSVLLMWLLTPAAWWVTNGPTRSFAFPHTVPGTLIGRAACLLFWGVLLGYLADRERSLNFRAFALGRSLVNAPAQLSFRLTLEKFLSMVRTLTGAREIVVAVQDHRSLKDFVWKLAERDGGGESRALQLRQLAPLERQHYFFDGPDGSWHSALRTQRDAGEMLRCEVVDSGGRRLPDQHFAFTGAFFLQEKCSTVLAVDFTVPDECSGRLFVLDSDSRVSPGADLAFVQSLIWEAMPSIYSVYLLRRLRSRARADERLRVAHEIHDGLLQSLISVEMQMEVLYQRAESSSPELAPELSRLHGILRSEILEARATMENLKLREMNPREMLEVASEMVANFQRETGITASFICDAEGINLAPHVCRQLASILQEALTNVRKHSEARNVCVRFALEDNWWKLTITDDGEGFKFSDRLAHAELAKTPRAPAVIRERALSIGAELDLASSPGQGSCVEVRLRHQESFG
jgi:signal transduction histidine kinase